MILLASKFDHNLITNVEKALETEMKTITEISSPENVEIIITRGKFDNSLVERFQNLKWVFVCAAGIDRIDVQKLNEKNIILSNSRGIHKTQIAEHVLGVMIYFSRRFDKFTRDKNECVWDPIDIEEMYGKTACIIGAGSIGEEIAKRIKAMGLTVYGYSLSGNIKEGFDEVSNDKNALCEKLTVSDYVIITLPLTNKTERLISDYELSLMKENAVLINVSRGKVVDEAALIRSLQNKHIKAGLDVFENEPLSECSELWKLDNVFITPHVAGRSQYYDYKAMEIFRAEYLRFIKGERLINQIDYIKNY